MGKYDFNCEKLPIVHIDGRAILKKETGSTSFAEGHYTRYWRYSLKTKRYIENEILTFDNDLKGQKKISLLG